MAKAEEILNKLLLQIAKEQNFVNYDLKIKPASSGGKLVFGLMIAVITLPTMLVRDTPEVNEDLNFATFAVEESSDIYVERLNGVINDYVKWGILK
ncbi:unnamed protein product [Arctia plantaginis]|uniref:Uncharacterized protein n=1 Tax=Arctia plantaginis TaxID=874455 RepID=A0A8S0YL93_ARCPL|nr:unnamed protein product [Arctia plantaginis]